MIDKESVLSNLAEMEDHNPDMAEISIKLMKYVVLDEVRCRSFAEARGYLRESYLEGVDEVSLTVAPHGQKIEHVEARFGVILKENR